MPLGGVPLLVPAIRSMNDAGIDDVVVTIPAGAEALVAFEQALAVSGVRAQLVVGASTRQGSILAAWQP